MKPRSTIARVAVVGLAMLTLTAVARAPHTTRAQAATAVSIQDFAYIPPTATVAAGTTITWTQRDTAPHTVTSGAAGDADAGAIFDSPRLSQGETFSFTFAEPGTYPYFCRVHRSEEASCRERV